MQDDQEKVKSMAMDLPSEDRRESAVANAGPADAPAPEPGAPLGTKAPRPRARPGGSGDGPQAPDARGVLPRFSAMQSVKDLDRSRVGYRVAKRAFDIAFSACVIAVGLVPGLLLAAAIRLDSPGNPFYGQARVGRTHRDGSQSTFTMWKFRSMRKGADRGLSELLDRSDVAGPMFKMREDPRVTRVGRFLRRHSIDEFPQFVNVLMGQMSVVGPRPPLPREVALYDERALQRLAVKPGLTGYWQVGGRSDLDFDEMVELDLAYIRDRSVWTDLRVIARTVRVVFTGEGAV